MFFPIKDFKFTQSAVDKRSLPIFQSCHHCWIQIRLAKLQFDIIQSK